jgi:hypothetical protein
MTVPMIVPVSCTPGGAAVSAAERKPSNSIAT